MCSMLEVMLAGLIGALIMCGMFISVGVLKFPDLTCEASYSIGCSLYCYLSAMCGISPIFCLLISIIVGILCGSLTSLLNWYLQAPKVVSGMITVTLIIGVLQLFPSIDYSGLAQVKFFRFMSLNAIIVTLITGAIAFVTYYFIISEAGLKFRAMNYSNMRCKSDLKSRVSLLAGLGFSNGVVALAGALSSQLCSSSITYIGNGVFIFGLVCLIIAELVINKNKFNIEKFFVIVVGIGAAIRFSLEFFSRIFDLSGNHAFAEVILALMAIFICSVLSARSDFRSQIIKNITHE